VRHALRIAGRARSRYSVAGLAALLVLVGVGSAGATVARPVGGTFSITPARRYVVAVPPVHLAATRVANTTENTLRVRVFSVFLSQLPSGAFTFGPSSSSLLAASRVLRVGASHFTLRPGASREVSLLWRELPPHARIANLGVVYQATPEVGPNPVQIVERLMGLDILRLPGRYRSTGRLTGVHVTQLKTGVLGFVLDMRNTGQAVAGPSRMEVSVRGRHGRVVLRRTLAGDIVLPAATREFILELQHRLPVGLYTVRAHAAFGSSHRLEARATFTLGAPNQLISSRLALGPLTAQGSSGHSAQVTAILKNTGTAAGRMAIALSLYRLDDGIPVKSPAAVGNVVSDTIAPGKSRRLNYHLGHLHTGTYRLIASYEESDGAPRTLVADFQAQPKASLYAQLRRFCVQHAISLPFLLLLIGSTSFTLMLVQNRRLRNALVAAEGRLRGRGGPKGL
jgi:hypothetical protein